jgi:hypothetical protein
MRQVAGFLVEYLQLDWRHGERWFHDTLVDADVAINAYMWQNGGHSGPVGPIALRPSVCVAFLASDPRLPSLLRVQDQWTFVMHPVFAAKKADPEGAYVREWLPALARLPAEYIHCPWEAPPSLLAAAGLRLEKVAAAKGVTYADRRARVRKGAPAGGAPPVGGRTLCSYPARVVVDLDAARAASHCETMAVRSFSTVTDRHPSGSYEYIVL